MARLLSASGFALGATMAFRAADLKAIGGFAAIREYLADDYQLGARIAALGKQRRAVRFSGRDESWRGILAGRLEASGPVVANHSRFPARGLLRLSRHPIDVLVHRCRRVRILADRLSRFDCAADRGGSGAKNTRTTHSQPLSRWFRCGICSGSRSGQPESGAGKSSGAACASGCFPTAESNYCDSANLAAGLRCSRGAVPT